jgi:hypothetical protein
MSKDGDKPIPPELPSAVVKELLKRYSHVYENISKKLI